MQKRKYCDIVYIVVKLGKCAKSLFFLYNGDIVKQQNTPFLLRLLPIFFFTVAIGAGIGLHSYSFSWKTQFSGVGMWNFQNEETATTTSPIIKPDFAIIPIVTYHSVRPHIDGESEEQEQFDITPELLKKHLEYLKREGFTTISFETLADYFDGETSLPQKPVILSFDDSWKNQYIYAFPLLKEYKMTATFFVFTNSLDRKNHLTWEETREMQKAGMEIGSHTKFHPYLGDIKDPAELKNEIVGSKNILEESINAHITSFAYPFGEHATTSINEVKHAGYRTARSLRSGVVQNKEDLYSLRSFLATDNFEDFRRMVERKEN